jgi:drug/metabolite transporter (DMT)-like permease
MSIVSYSLVLYAVTRAPVGYVATLRESSVLVAAFAGWRLLDEGDHRRRIAAAAVIVGGLALLVVGR